MLTRQFLRASVAEAPGPTETAYWSKETSKMVRVASMLTQAWPAGQPEPMALTLMILTSDGAAAGGARTWPAGMAAATPKKRARMERIMKGFGRSG